MKRIGLFLMVLFFGIITYAQKKVTSDTTSKKTPDTKITEEASGVRRSIGYKFSTVVTDSDPGNGLFRYNNPVISRVTWIFVDNNDISGEDQTNWYSTWDKTTGATARGSINIVEHEGKNVNLFNVTGVFIKGAGYWKIPVEFISGSLPANGTAYYYVFNRIAHQKPKPAEEPKPVSVPPVVQEPAPVAVPPVVQEPAPVAVPPVVQEPAPAAVPPVVQEPAPVAVPPVVQEPAPAAVPPVVQEPAPVVVPPVAQENPPAQQPQPAQTAPARQTTQAAEARRQAPPTQTAQGTVAAQTTQTKPAAQTTQPAQQTPPNQPSQTTQSAQAPQNYQPAAYNQPSQVSKPADVPNPYANVSMTSTPRRKCYRGIIELGYAWGVGEYGINNFRFNFINGIMIGRFSSIGLGLGYRRYFTGSENYTDRSLYSPVSQFPVFLDLRTSFSTKRITPYLAVGIGGSAGYIEEGSDSNTSRQEGLLFSPSGGIWFNVSDRFAVFAGVAYEMQKLEYVLISDNSHYKKNTSSISLNIGIAF